MAVYRYAEGNLGFYGYDALANYTVATRGDTVTVLDWAGGQGGLDPTHYAAHVTLTYTGYASYVQEDGPDAGQVQVTGGILTGVSYSDAGGNSLLEISGLSVRLPVFLAVLARGDSYAAWQMVAHAASTITGANSAAGPGHAGTGDVIDTTAGADTVSALGGDDFVQDRGGADSYFGGTGFDTLSYDGWNFTPWAVQMGIVVNQLLGTVRGPDGLTDSIAGFEDISGTFMADVMRGNAGANAFEGGAGADTLDGRGGRDTVSYAKDAGWGGTDGIRVNLGAATVRDGFGCIDRVYNVESIIGTATRDVFLDNGGDNAFDGGAGNDVMHFTRGDDFARGGAGADTFWFDGNFADDTVADFSSAEGDKIRISGAVKFGDLHFDNIVTDDGLAVLVSFGANTVVLQGLVSSALHASDFGF